MMYRFQEFARDLARFELRAHDAAIHLEPKSFELLELLVRNARRLVSKDEIFEQIWPGGFVTEPPLSGAIKSIRRALGDDGAAQKFIKTIRGRGFRFVAEVDHPGPLPSAQPISAPPPEPQLQAPPAIAMPPFDMLRADPGDTALAEAIPTELIAGLFRLKSLKVLARRSTAALPVTTRACPIPSSKIAISASGRTNRAICKTRSILRRQRSISTLMTPSATLFLGARIGSTRILPPRSAGVDRAITLNPKMPLRSMTAANSTRSSPSLIPVMRRGSPRHWIRSVFELTVVRPPADGTSMADARAARQWPSLRRGRQPPPVSNRPQCAPSSTAG